MGEVYLLDRQVLQHLLLTLPCCFWGVREQLGRDPGQGLDTANQLPLKPEPEIPTLDFPHKTLSQFLGGGDFVARILWHETRAGLGPR